MVVVVMVKNFKLFESHKKYLFEYEIFFFQLSILFKDSFCFVLFETTAYTVSSFPFGTNLAAASSIIEDTIFFTLPNPDDISQQFRVIRRPSVLNVKDCIGGTQQSNLIPIILGESRSLARVPNKRSTA